MGVVGHGPEVLEVPLNHMELVSRSDVYNPALLSALAVVRERQRIRAA